MMLGLTYPVRGFAPRNVIKSPLSCTVMADIIFEVVNFAVGAGERPLAGVAEVEVVADVDVDVAVDDEIDVKDMMLLFWLLAFRLFRLLLLRRLLMRKSNLCICNLSSCAKWLQPAGLPLLLLRLLLLLLLRLFPSRDCLFVVALAAKLNTDLLEDINDEDLIIDEKLLF